MLKTNIERKRSINTNSILIISCIVLFFVTVLPAFRGGTWLGHDTLFHAGKSLMVLDSWEIDDVFPQKTCEIGKYRYLFGPINIFYPPLSGWLASIIVMIATKFGFNTVEALCAAQSFSSVLIVFGGFVSMLFCTMVLFRKLPLSLLSSSLYISSTYFLTDIFRRAAMGEAIALCFIPLIILGMYSTFYGNGKHSPYLTVGMCGVILSNLPSVMIVIIGMAVFSLFNIKNFFNKRIILLLIANILLTSIITLFYFANFINIASSELFFPATHIEYIYAFGMTFRSIFDPIETSMPLNLKFNITIPMIFWSFFCLYYSRQNSGAIKIVVLCLIGIVFTLKYLYYPGMVKPIDELLEKYYYFQFSYRLFIIIIPLLCIISALNCKNIIHVYKKFKLLILLTIIVCVATSYNFETQVITMSDPFTYNYQYYDYLPKKSCVYGSRSYDLNGYNFTIEEPTSLKIKYNNIKNNELLMLNCSQIINRMHCGSNILSFYIDNGDTDTIIETSLFYYKGYRAYLTDEKGISLILSTFESDSGSLAIKIPEDSHGTITIVYDLHHFIPNMEFVSLTGIALLFVFMYIVNTYKFSPIENPPALPED